MPTTWAASMHEAAAKFLFNQSPNSRGSRDLSILHLDQHQTAVDAACKAKSGAHAWKEINASCIEHNELRPRRQGRKEEEAALAAELTTAVITPAIANAAAVVAVARAAAKPAAALAAAALALALATATAGGRRRRLRPLPRRLPFGFAFMTADPSDPSPMPPPSLPRCHRHHLAAAALALHCYTILHCLNSLCSRPILR